MIRARVAAHLEYAFTRMDDAPIVLAGHGVFIALAQEAYIVGLLQIIHRRRVTPELPVEPLDSAGIFMGAVLKLVFFFTLDLLADAGKLDAQGNQHQRHQEHDRKQNVALLLSLAECDCLFHSYYSIAAAL